MAGNQPANGEPRKGYETVEKVQAEPWDPTKEYLGQILGQAQQNFDTGTGTAYPDFPTVLGLGQTTNSAIDRLKSMAGPTALSRQASGAVGGLLSGDSRYGEVYDRAMAPSAASTYLTGMAQGGQANPYLDQLLDSGSERIANQVRAAYSAKGRYGSEDFTDALSRGISDFQSPLLFNAYETDQNRRLQAAGLLDDTRLAGANMGLGAVGAENANTMNAANMAGLLDERRYGGVDRLLSAGLLEDSNAQARRDADVQRFLWENGGADQASLANYLNTVGPIAGMGGSQQVQEPRKPGQKILGGLLSGIGAIGSFF